MILRSWIIDTTPGCDWRHSFSPDRLFAYDPSLYRDLMRLRCASDPWMRQLLALLHMAYRRGEPIAIVGPHEDDARSILDSFFKKRSGRTKVLPE